MTLDVMQIQRILPHRVPFLLVDRVTEVKVGEYVEAYKNISISEPVFQGHFPDHPIYPGVMIIEGMAQAGAVLAFYAGDMSEEAAKSKVVYFMSIDYAKFRKPIRPGDRLDYKVGVIKHKGAVWVLDAKAFVSGDLACEAQLKAMVIDKENQ
ncbi:MAG: 3-hydroxyacyl-ACP dehydratase FabZ [Helicobacteraceae bacterium]|jgi:3-hydroxyacyl-[acyl-carrier-protein] dehydratase|nr:3-hydroxyacyl-ACP dehydratase FabZ [Helicobacteraceae bacterium]